MMIRKIVIAENFIEDDSHHNIEKITKNVNKVVNDTELHWQLYRSSLTRTMLPLERYRDFVRQYDYFVDAVKHYYYDDSDMTAKTNFLNVINMLERSRNEFDNILPECVFNNLEYAINRLSNYIQTNFLGE